MNTDEYKAKYSEDDAVGWAFIDKAVDKLYPNQEPKHYATMIKYFMGGDDPLDGVSVYKSDKDKEHYHFVSYGMSELYYNESAAGGDFSKWGFEFTFRLRPFEEDDDDPRWVVSLMQNLARYVFETGNWFDEYHFIPANGPIRLETDTEIVGIAFVLDPELGSINTPHGEVNFLQIVGITEDELEQLKANPKISETKKLLEKLKEKSPLLVTDLKRK